MFSVLYVNEHMDLSDMFQTASCVCYDHGFLLDYENVMGDQIKLVSLVNICYVPWMVTVEGSWV